MAPSLASVATVLLAAASTASAKSLISRNTTAVTCVSGLYMIAARGSDESPGEGKVSEVVDLIQNQVPDSTSVAVQYPATIFSSGGYPDSVTDGIENAIDQIQLYVNTCGSQGSIVLLGYSQGGNVMTDVLAGGVDKPQPIQPPYSDHISGIVVFGDPTFTVGQSFDAGNATKSGIFSRGGSSLQMLNTYADILQSYCDDHDPVCASGDDIDVHYDEVPTNAQAAADFIVGLQGSS